MIRPWSDELAGKTIAIQAAEIDRLQIIIASYRDVESGLRAEIDRMKAAMRYAIEAHETGRYEPARVAYENLKNTLDGPTGAD